MQYSASPVQSPRSARSPVRRCRTASGRPPLRNATTGSPEAPASTAVKPKDSSTIDGMKKLEDGGAAAIVMFSLFEEQIRNQYLRSIDRNWRAHLQAMEPPPLLPDEEPGRIRLDVPRINVLQLLTLGLQLDQIAIAPHCTYQESDKFFSYRRTREKKVQWSGIVSR